ncbi:MAG: fucose isomerase, partial [Clostridia bacterium]|nr:fucose isomerase [Clostridia bacterium]
MLKNIPSLVSPELLKILCEMGHGDEIVIGDGNFPAASVNSRVVRLDGHGAPEVMDAILSLIPADRYVEKPFALMATGKGESRPQIWDEYQRIAEKYEPELAEFELVERFAFYDRAKKAYAVVATGESAIYA